MSAAWIQTRVGRAFDLLEPRVADVSLFDVAMALGALPRFTGHTSFYSVAEHSCHVAEVAGHIARERGDSAEDVAAYRLAGLLHDAHEAYVGDLSSPLKVALGTLCPDLPPRLRMMESRISVAIVTAMGISDANTARVLARLTSETVKHADLAMLAAERDQLMGPAPQEWMALPEAASVKVRHWKADRATSMWYAALTMALDEVEP